MLVSSNKYYMHDIVLAINVTNEDPFDISLFIVLLHVKSSKNPTISSSLTYTAWNGGSEDLLVGGGGQCSVRNDYFPGAMVWWLLQVGVTCDL